MSLSPRTPTASWSDVATWYDAHLQKPDTYHAKILLPNMLRLVDPKKDDTIVDLACGTGFFTKAFTEKGATVTGIDVGADLIALARTHVPSATFHIGSAEDLSMIKSESVKKVTIVLAIQNIEHAESVIAEAARILVPRGYFHIVMNHPAFRIPKSSAWEYDAKRKIQYRRVERYISESQSAIDMHPGTAGGPQTVSFHRPLQYYFKALAKARFSIDRLEEWTSHKESDSGPRAEAENRARKEIPLFLYLCARKSAD